MQAHTMQYVWLQVIREGTVRLESMPPQESPDAVVWIASIVAPRNQQPDLRSVVGFGFL